MWKTSSAVSLGLDSSYRGNLSIYVIRVLVIHDDGYMLKLIKVILEKG